MDAKKEAKRRQKQDALDAAMVEFRTLLLLLPPERETPRRSAGSTKNSTSFFTLFIRPLQEHAGRGRRAGGKGRGGHVSAAALHDVY